MTTTYADMDINENGVSVGPEMCCVECRETTVTFFSWHGLCCDWCMETLIKDSI